MEPVKVNDPVSTPVSINAADEAIDATLQVGAKPVQENDPIIATNCKLTSGNRVVSYDQISEAESGSESD